MAQEQWSLEPTDTAQAARIMRELKVISSEDIRDQHQELLSGMRDLYQVLIDLCFLEESNLLQPPHEKPHVPAKKFALQGMDPEAIAVLRELPYLYKVYQVAPKAVACSYTSKHHEMKFPRDPLDPQGGINGVAALPPWIIAVTRPLPPPLTDFEHARLYDVRRKKLGRLCDSIYKNGIGDESPFLEDAQPPQIVLSYWVALLKTLEWLPSLSKEEPEILVKPIPFNETLASVSKEEEPNMPESFRSSYLHSMRRSSNMYWAMRKVYEDCGWPGPLRKDDFNRRKLEWHTETRMLTGEWLDNFVSLKAGKHAV